MLLHAFSFLKYIQARLSGKQFRQLFTWLVIVSAGIVFLAVVGLTYAGFVAPWSGRFYSLYDTGLVNNPIYTSPAFMYNLVFMCCIMHTCVAIYIIHVHIHAGFCH